MGVFWGNSRGIRPLTPRVVRNLRAFFIAIASIIGCVGLFFIVMGALEWDRARSSASWPSVEGTVTESRVLQSSRGRRGARARSYNAGITYEYQVEGRSHEGERVSFRVRSAGQSQAQETATRYPEGSRVRVFYDSQSPGTSVLEPGWDWSNAIPVAIGLFSVGFCTLFVWLTLKSTRRTLESLNSPPR